MDSIHQARLAQSVEHQTLNRRVVGSSPTVDKEFFILYFVASDTLLAGRLAPCKWNQAWRPSELYMCIEREKVDFKNRPGCLFIRTFFTEEFLYPLSWNCMHPPSTSLICEINTCLILWKFQVILVIAYIFIIKVINYALWHTF